MGRRALPKIDPTLDLNRRLLLLGELDAPLNPSSLFGREAPLEVEMGSGKGLFLENAALRTPDHDFLGIELAHRYARFAAARLARRGLVNAAVVDGDGLSFFRDFLPDSSAAVVHVYFPDPWWKARHHKRRVMNEAFLSDVQRTLVPGGRLHFWTDVLEYFDLSLETIANCTSLAGPYPVAERPAEHDLDFRTHFERRTRLHGARVYRAEFANPESAPTASSGA